MARKSRIRFDHREVKNISRCAEEKNINQEGSARAWCDLAALFLPQVHSPGRIWAKFGHNPPISAEAAVP